MFRKIFPKTIIKQKFNIKKISTLTSKVLKSLYAKHMYRIGILLKIDKKKYSKTSLVFGNNKK